MYMYTNPAVEPLAAQPAVAPTVKTIARAETSLDNGTASAIVWKSNFAPLLMPSTRCLLDGVAAWVLHRSIRWTWPHRRRKHPDSLVDFHTGPCSSRRASRPSRGRRPPSTTRPRLRRRGNQILWRALPSPRHRRDAGRESQLWGSSQILSYFIRLVIAARRTLSVDERLGSPHVGSARRHERACPCSMAWVFHQSIQHHGRAVAEK